MHINKKRCKRTIAPLVAELFLIKNKNCGKKIRCTHIDGDYRNCRADNLKICDIQIFDREEWQIQMYNKNIVACCKHIFKKGRKIMVQISMFDGSQKFKIDKPIRLIELFGGYGSQSLALKYLGIPFEHYLLSEWAIKSIQAYKDLHFENDNTDYSKDKELSEIKEWLNGRISSDYSTPLTDKQIERLSENETRKIYNNMKACNNLGSISKIKGSELNIVDVDKFTYILTYSFPCQDLSSAGKGLGMAKGSNTRSSLLWEVERLLKETENLPQVLLMENVPEIIGAKNIKHFAKLVEFLDGLGYKSKWGLLNAKDFGIPQNRKRCFMVSVLGDYYYNMPKTMPLKYCLRDFLDKEVDDKYYLSEKVIMSLNIHKERSEAKGNGFGWKPTTGGGIANTITTGSGYRPQSNFIIKQTRGKI